MNTSEFIEQLSIFFKSSEDFNDKKYYTKIQRYVKILQKKGEEVKETKSINYERTLDYILKNYKYKDFPNFNYILSNLQYDKKIVKSKPQEPKKHKVYRWGHEYIFEVCDSISGAHTLDELRQTSDRVEPYNEEEEFEKNREKINEFLSKMRSKQLNANTPDFL